jgi:PIN domain nuclease of toxin-antitoxin system
MRFLLDTHFVLWLPIGGSGLDRAARTLLNDMQNRFSFSVVSLWEVALKRSRYGKSFAFDPGELRIQMLENGYDELPILASHVLAVNGLAPIHNDPFDRLLIAQAIVERITLLTVDSAVARYPGPIRRV